MFLLKADGYWVTIAAWPEWVVGDDLSFASKVKKNAALVRKSLKSEIN